MTMVVRLITYPSYWMRFHRHRLMPFLSIPKRAVWKVHIAHHCNTHTVSPIRTCVFVCDLWKRTKNCAQKTNISFEPFISNFQWASINMELRFWLDFNYWNTVSVEAVGFVLRLCSIGHWVLHQDSKGYAKTVIDRKRQIQKKQSISCVGKMVQWNMGKRK